MANPALRWTGKAILGFSLTIPVIGARQAPVTETLCVRTGTRTVVDQSAVLRIIFSWCVSSFQRQPGNLP